MFKKYLVLGLTVLILNLFLSTSIFAATNAEKAVRFAAKVKANVTKLGTGKDARIAVELRNKTKLKGYVSQINENSFVVIEDATGAATEVAYSNAKQVKGNNLSTGATIAIALGAGFGLLLLLNYFFGG